MKDDSGSYAVFAEQVEKLLLALGWEKGPNWCESDAKGLGCDIFHSRTRVICHCGSTALAYTSAGPLGLKQNGVFTLARPHRSAHCALNPKAKTATTLSSEDPGHYSLIRCASEGLGLVETMRKLGLTKKVCIWVARPEPAELCSAFHIHPCLTPKLLPLPYHPPALFTLQETWYLLLTCTHCVKSNGTPQSRTATIRSN